MLVEGVNGVRSTVVFFSHFLDHFQKIAIDWPEIEDPSFKLITRQKGSVLTLHFSKVEIKKTE